MKIESNKIGFFSLKEKNRDECINNLVQLQKTQKHDSPCYERMQRMQRMLLLLQCSSHSLESDDSSLLTVLRPFVQWMSCDGVEIFRAFFQKTSRRLS